MSFVILTEHRRTCLTYSSLAVETIHEQKLRSCARAALPGAIDAGSGGEEPLLKHAQLSQTALKDILHILVRKPLQNGGVYPSLWLEVDVDVRMVLILLFLRDSLPRAAENDQVQNRSCVQKGRAVRRNRPKKTEVKGNKAQSLSFHMLIDTNIPVAEKNPWKVQKRFSSLSRGAIMRTCFAPFSSYVSPVLATCIGVCTETN
jgi:hypothetical protein